MKCFDKKQNLLKAINIHMSAEQWTESNPQDGVVIATAEEVPQDTAFVLLLNKTTGEVERINC